MGCYQICGDQTTNSYCLALETMRSCHVKCTGTCSLTVTYTQTHTHTCIQTVTDRASVAVNMCGFGPKSSETERGFKYKGLFHIQYSGELLSLSIGRGQKATVSRNITCSASKWGRGQHAAVQALLKIHAKPLK